MDPDDLRAAWARMTAARDAYLVDLAEMGFELEDAPELGEDEVVLYGFEGQVDRVWRLPPANRMDRLRVPIRLTPRAVWRPDVDPTDLGPRIAVYECIGPATYVRVS